MLDDAGTGRPRGLPCRGGQSSSWRRRGSWPVEHVAAKSQIQALDRTAPVLPLLPGVPERRTHDYVRNGTTNLYAALNVASGQVIADMTARHRTEEFRRFLSLIDKHVPASLDVHAVLDNSSTHKTPAIQRWLVRHPRFTLHFTPTYSSWLNLVSSAGSPSSPPNGSSAAPTAPSENSSPRSVRQARVQLMRPNRRLGCRTRSRGCPDPGPPAELGAAICHPTSPPIEPTRPASLRSTAPVGVRT